MHLAHEGIVNLAAREWDGFESEWRDGRRRLGWEFWGIAERHERESHLTLRIYVEQAIHGVVNESAYYFGRQAQGSADGQQVGE